MRASTTERSVVASSAAGSAARHRMKESDRDACDWKGLELRGTTIKREHPCAVRRHATASHVKQRQETPPTVGRNDLNRCREAHVFILGDDLLEISSMKDDVESFRCKHFERVGHRRNLV